MKKQKLIVLFAFLLIVSGTLVFISNHVYGLSNCNCSPDFEPGDGWCYPGDYYYNWYPVDSYCLYGECKYEIEVLCEMGSSPRGQLWVRVHPFTLAVMSPGCCDYENPLYN